MQTRTYTTVIDVDPGAVFRTITDLDRLTDWNDIIRAVVERPARLEPGAEWVVELHALGQTWRSRSTVLEVDPVRGRFAYRSRTDDSNPSWAEWTWSVGATAEGRSAVTVEWHLHPITFWRRVLLARVRDRQLRKREVPASVARLATAARATSTAPGTTRSG